jgi:hypothetical protein
VGSSGSRVPLELHDPPIDPTGDHPAVLLTDPTRRSHEILDAACDDDLLGGRDPVERREEEVVRDSDCASRDSGPLHESSAGDLRQPEICFRHPYSLVSIEWLVTTS